MVETANAQAKRSTKVNPSMADKLHECDLATATAIGSVRAVRAALP